MRLFKDSTIGECRNVESQADYGLIMTPPTSKAYCED